jgi:hypothetical protein
LKSMRGFSIRIMSIQAYNLYDINSQSEFLKCDKAKRIESKANPKRTKSDLGQN